MKIVTWNCNGAFRNKTEYIQALNADIHVIQECEDPANGLMHLGSWAENHLWVGTSKHNGIGIFAKNGYRIKPLNWAGHFRLTELTSRSSALTWSSNELKLFLPFSINDKYTALAVWTKGSGGDAFRYIGQFWKYLQIHRQQLAKNNTLILVDFNSNTIWDVKDRWWNHSDVIIELADIGIHSLYHRQFGEEQGKEKLATYFHHRHTDKPYHIDYVFMSENVLNRSKIFIGEQWDWLKASDHLPLTVEIAD